MDDIGIIGGDGVVEMLAIAPDIVDRHSASMHFLKSARKARPGGRVRIWYARTAVAELKAAYETISDSLPNRNFAKVWERSKEKQMLDADPLLKCLGKVRDLSLHTAKQVLDNRPFAYGLATQDGIIHQRSVEVFASQIKVNEYTKKSSISSENVCWFNRQVVIWPIEQLVIEGWWRLACALNNFTAKAKRSELTALHSA